MKRILGTSGSWGPTLLRAALGIIFLAHGSQKLFGWFGGYGLQGTVQGMHQMMGIPVFLGYLAAFTEFFGGLGALLGLLTRPAALGLGIVMAVAMLKVHLPNGFFLNATHPGIEYTLALGGMALSLVVSGGGALSLDRLLTAPKENAALRLEKTTAAHRQAS